FPSTSTTSTSVYGSAPLATESRSRRTPSSSTMSPRASASGSRARSNRHVYGNGGARRSVPVQPPIPTFPHRSATTALTSDLTTKASRIGSRHGRALRCVRLEPRLQAVHEVALRHRAVYALRARVCHASGAAAGDSFPLQRRLFLEGVSAGA